MASIVRWSPEAVEDLESIASYIARDSTFYAAAVVRRILESAGGLKVHPHIGRMVPEMAKRSLRERVVYGYRLVYLIEADSILIVAIMHGRQHFDARAVRVDPSEES